MRYHKAVLVAVFVMALAMTGQAQTLMDRLNDALLFAEKIDRAIEKGKVKIDTTLYEFVEDKDDWLFSGRTTLSLSVTNNKLVRFQMLETSGSHYNVKSLYFTSNLTPIVLTDVSKHEYNRCFVFAGDEPVIFAEAIWSERKFQFGKYKVQRVTPKEYQYAKEMALEFEQMLKNSLSKQGQF